MKITINYEQWEFKLNGCAIMVTNNSHDESRIYGLPDSTNIIRVEHEYEYIRLYDEDDSMYQFKFEEGDFLVGDIFNKEGEHTNEIASWVFGEDLLMSN